MTTSKRQIIETERFFEGTYLFIHFWTGLNINARIHPIIIESKIGLRRKKDKTASNARIMFVITFLKYSSLRFIEKINQQNI